MKERNRCEVNSRIFFSTFFFLYYNTIYTYTVLFFLKQNKTRLSIFFLIEFVLLVSILIVLFQELFIFFFYITNHQKLHLIA